MSRRNNAAQRCRRCRLHGNLCFCALIPRIETRTRVVLLIHRYEDRKTTNTGRLAVECLPNSEVVVRGHDGAPDAPVRWDPATTPLLLFPHEDATPIEELPAPSRPVTLFVPDGTWRQASKMRARVPGLCDVPCVRLPPGAPSAYRLRTEAHAQGLATMEAIARVLGVLEGAEVQRGLEDTLRTMVERTLWARGLVGERQVKGGIPEDARRHGPRGVPPARAGEA